MSETADIIRRIDEYCAKRGISETTFGMRALNDWGFVKRLKRGADLRLKTVRKIENFLAEERA